MKNEAVSQKGPFAAVRGEWPSAETERVADCPICGSMDRFVAYEGQRDRAFGVAPGAWSSHRCGVCGCIYIDPRPTEASVHKAYSAYYTHHEPDEPFAAVSGTRRERRRRAELKRLRVHWGYPIELGSQASLPELDRPGRIALDRSIRHLAHQVDGRLLDIGCGNGAYLLRMRQLGWSGFGIEIDPESAAIARSKGLDVTGTALTDTKLTPASIEAVTLDHVVEHLHDPVTVLRVCWTLLAPGGQLWIATPNVDSSGHRRFKADWFALQPPSHIALHSRTSMLKLLERAGIEAKVEFKVTQEASWMYEASTRIRLGQNPLGKEPIGYWRRRTERIRAHWADAATIRNPSLGEELVAIVRR